MDLTDESDDFGDFEEGDDKTKLAKQVKAPEPKPEPKVRLDFTKPTGTESLQKPPKKALNGSSDINLFSSEDIDLFGQHREETKAEQLEKAKIEVSLSLSKNKIPSAPNAKKKRRQNTTSTSGARARCLRC